MTHTSPEALDAFNRYADGLLAVVDRHLPTLVQQLHAETPALADADAAAHLHAVMDTVSLGMALTIWHTFHRLAEDAVGQAPIPEPTVLLLVGMMNRNIRTAGKAAAKLDVAAAGGPDPTSPAPPRLQ